jgi:ribosomal protein L31
MNQALYAHMNNKRKIKKKKDCQVPVAHACHPSYSGGSD